MLVTLGTQALMIRNGLFVSERSLDQIHERELKLLRMPVLPPEMITIDEERRAVVAGGTANLPVPPMRAAYSTEKEGPYWLDFRRWSKIWEINLGSVMKVTTRMTALLFWS